MVSMQHHEHRRRLLPSPPCRLPARLTFHFAVFSRVAFSFVALRLTCPFLCIATCGSVIHVALHSIATWRLIVSHFPPTLVAGDKCSLLLSGAYLRGPFKPDNGTSVGNLYFPNADA